MSFRARLTLAAAAAVAVAVVGRVRDHVRPRRATSFAARSTTRCSRARRRCRRSFDVIGDPGGNQFLGLRPDRFGGVAVFTQLVRQDGKAIAPQGSDQLPVSIQAARGREGRDRRPFYEDAHVEGTHVRVLTLPLGGGYAVQVAGRSRRSTASLGKIKRWLIALAARRHRARGGLGLLVARAVLAPVQRLTRAARARRRDSRSLPADRRVGHRRALAPRRDFNTMLGALEESARAQRQLVSDASHELRTPLTSLRTNIEVLARDDALPPDDREQLLARRHRAADRDDRRSIAELVELARGDQPPVEPEDVRLDLAPADAIERTRRNRPGISFKPDLQESIVRGRPATIERAISNLLDNAAKWSPPDGEIEVTVRDGEVTVRDHGPGIDPDDLPFVFDRFYRAPSARGMPGSGLGLAIVRQVAEAHGGTSRPSGRRGRHADAALAARAERPLNLLDTS